MHYQHTRTLIGTQPLSPRSPFSSQSSPSSTEVGALLRKSAYFKARLLRLLLQKSSHFYSLQTSIKKSTPQRHILLLLLFFTTDFTLACLFYLKLSPSSTLSSPSHSNALQFPPSFLPTFLRSLLPPFPPPLRDHSQQLPPQQRQHRVHSTAGHRPRHQQCRRRRQQRQLLLLPRRGGCREAT